MKLDFIPNQSVQFTNRSKEADTYNWKILNEERKLLDMDTFELAYKFPGAGIYQVKLTGKNNETGIREERTTNVKLQLSGSHKEDVLSALQSAIDIITDSTSSNHEKNKAKASVLQLISSDSKSSVNNVEVDLESYLDQLIADRPNDLIAIDVDATFDNLGKINQLNLKESRKRGEVKPEEPIIANDVENQDDTDLDRSKLTPIEVEDSQINQGDQAILEELRKKREEEERQKKAVATERAMRAQLISLFEKQFNVLKRRGNEGPLVVPDNEANMAKDQLIDKATDDNIRVIYLNDQGKEVVIGREKTLGRFIRTLRKTKPTVNTKILEDIEVRRIELKNGKVSKVYVSALKI